MTQSQVECYSELMRSVCVISSPWRYGTAFRVGSKYLITAFHLISDIINHDRRNLESVSVHFGENIRQHSPPKYKLDNDYRYDDQLDIAILMIDNPDENLPCPLPLSSGNIEGNITSLSLIGYGNPDCETKKHLDYCCQVIPQNSPIISEAHRFMEQNSLSLKQALRANGKYPHLVDFGYAGYDARHNVIINCYSEKGASGGPLIDCRNPEFPQVLGVLTHGLPVCFWDLKKDDQLKFPNKYRFEVGTRMTDIKEFINKIDTQFSKDWFPYDP